MKIEKDYTRGPGWHGILVDGKPILDCSIEEVQRAAMLLFDSSKMGRWKAPHARIEFVEDWLARTNLGRV